MKKLKKLMILTTLIMALLVNSFSLALAEIGKNQVLDNNSTINILKKVPLGRIPSSDNLQKSVNLYIPEETIPLYLPPQIDNDLSSRSLARASAQTKYTFADLNRLNNYELVDLLVTIKWDDITDIFQYNDDAYKFYNDRYRMQALIDALDTRGSQYTANDNKGIPTLVEVIRAGFYLGFYNNNLKYLDEREFHDKTLPALMTIISNSNFKLGTTEQDRVVNAVGALIGNGSCNVEIVRKVTPIMEQYVSNFDIYIKDKSKGDAIYAIIRGIEYDITMYADYEARVKPNETQWYGEIDQFINKLSEIALHGEVTLDNGWLINNGIYAIASLGKYHTFENKGLEVLTQAMKIHPYLGEQFFQAVSGINYNYNGKDIDGNMIDFDKIKKEGEQKYYPDTYIFDDGKIIIRTGDKVTEEKVMRLYWASKEVNAQYFRTIGRDEPLELGNIDDILTIIIYNDPDEYTMNGALNGLQTDNGGMYIESWGTFYTYERTPEQSTYTLEELFRHEFTHYLQGRYMVPGMWGDSQIYHNDRLTWYEEGGAELFAGSTRTSGVLPRKSMVDNLLYTSLANRYNISKTVHSSYNDGFEFYTYACMLMNYMYDNDFYAYDRLSYHIKLNDISGYDNYIRDLSNDMNLNKRYQDYMQELVDKSDSLTIPLVSDDYLIKHPDKNLSEIQSEIISISNITDVKVTEQTSQLFDTFALSGTYTGEYSLGKLNDINKMNDIADNLLHELDTLDWSGYKTLTCYFINHRVNSENKYQFDVVFRGLLSGDNTIEPTENKLPISNPNGPYAGVKGETTNFSSEGSHDPDGIIASYLWDFGDENISEDSNPIHIYNSSGNFTVSLKVTDDKGATNIKNTIAVITESPTVVEGITHETEPNNDFNNANGPILSNLPVSGSIDANDIADIFYFDVIESGEVEINVMQYGHHEQINWLLYHESDLNNYTAYPSQNENGTLKGSLNLQPGRYYLQVYYVAGDSTQYKININYINNQN